MDRHTMNTLAVVDVITKRNVTIHILLTMTRVNVNVQQTQVAEMMNIMMKRNVNAIAT